MIEDGWERNILLPILVQNFKWPFLISPIAKTRSMSLSKNDMKIVRWSLRKPCTLSIPPDRQAILVCGMTDVPFSGILIVCEVYPSSAKDTQFDRHGLWKVNGTLAVHVDGPLSLIDNLLRTWVFSIIGHKSICLVIIQSCSVKETFGYQHLASPQKSSVWAYRFHNGTYLAWYFLPQK